MRIEVEAFPQTQRYKIIFCFQEGGYEQRIEPVVLSSNQVGQNNLHVTDQLHFTHASRISSVAEAGSNLQRTPTGRTVFGQLCP